MHRARERKVTIASRLRQEQRERLLGALGGLVLREVVDGRRRVDEIDVRRRWLLAGDERRRREEAAEAAEQRVQFVTIDHESIRVWVAGSARLRLLRAAWGGIEPPVFGLAMPKLRL